MSVTRAGVPPPTSFTLRSAAEADTESFGETLAPLLEPGDLIALGGPLGAGKTCFVRGLARGLAARARVRSPTFTLVNRYHGRIPLVHVDLYRLETLDVDGLGLDEERERAAIVAEWAERLPGAYRADALQVELEILAGDERLLRVSAAGARAAALLDAWRRATGGAP